MEARKKALAEAIEAEKIKAKITEDEHSIKAYFQKYANANLKNPKIGELLLDYFIDKIYVYDDRLEITGWFSEDRRGIAWQAFADGEIQFNTFALSSTIQGREIIDFTPFFCSLFSESRDVLLPCF